MSERSFKLFHRAGRSYLAKLTFPDGKTSEIDTHEKTERAAASRAKYVLRQRWAKRRHYRRTKLQAAGKPVPPELAPQRPGRRKSTTRSLAPSTRKRKPEAPAIDAGATADKLRALAADGLGDNDVPPAPEIPGAGAADPAPGEGGGPAAPAAPPSEIPPIPPEVPPSGEPLKPEVIPPGGPSDGELMSEMISTAICAGTIRGVRWLGENSSPPWMPAEPHQGSLEWLQRGLTNKIRERLGDRIVSDGTKIVVGFIGVVASMCIGAQPMYAARPPQAGAAATEPDESSERHAAPAPAPPPPRSPPPRPAPAPPQLMASKNGIPAAVGRF
jgi:hypothetical protein